MADTLTSLGMKGGSTSQFRSSSHCHSQGTVLWEETEFLRRATIKNNYCVKCHACTIILWGQYKSLDKQQNNIVT